MFKPSNRHVAVMAILAAVVASAFAASQMLGSDAPEPTSVSNVGTSTAVGNKAKASLKRTVGGQPQLLGTRGEQRFYRLDNTSKGTCYAIARGIGAAEDFAFITCPKPKSFPTTDRPVVDASVAEKHRDGKSSLFSVQGWAADEVAKILAIDRNGNAVASAKVDGNLYVIDPEALAGKGAVTIVAANKRGEALYTKRFEYELGSGDGY